MTFLDLTIRVVGTGCPRCQALHQTVINVLSRLDLMADLRMADYPAPGLGVTSTPGLVINGRVTCQGRVPGEAEIESWIRDASARGSQIDRNN